MKYLTKFETNAAYNAAKDGLIKPNVSYIVEGNIVEYKPYVPPFFAKLTLNNGSTVELQGSGTLTDTMVSPYEASIVSAEIGELCTTIADSVFQNCEGLTSVSIPDSVTIIGYAAFGGCTSLTNITIGSGVTSISGWAFLNCRGLTSVTIGNSVTSINTEAFRGCTSLTSITSLATTAPTIQSSTFQNVKTNGTLTVPSGSSGYDVWMGTGNFYLGKYGWTKVEQ